MEGLKTIELNVNVYAQNDRIAEEIRRKNREAGTFLVNLMASPGAGKTQTLLKTTALLREEFRIGVMEADIEAAVDAEVMQAAGLRSIQIHTGGECAMNAQMTAEAMEAFHTEDLDLLFLENVGNLVCPAEEDVGADLNAVILSVPEGDDKPLKYPLMFRVVDAVLINKIDTRKFFRFDDEAVVRRIHALNPKAEIFFLSAKTGEGVAAWAEYLRGRIQLQKRRPNE